MNPGSGTKHWPATAVIANVGHLAKISNDVNCKTIEENKASKQMYVEFQKCMKTTNQAYRTIVCSTYGTG